MESHRGYYSLIQFCPDRGRLEAANVGVLLFCPDLGYLDVQTTGKLDRVARRFGSNRFDSGRLASILRSMGSMIRDSRTSLNSLESLNHFIASRANAVLLSPLRPMTVSYPDEELQRLFVDLVDEVHPPRSERRLLLPQLAKSFKSLARVGRAQLDVTVPLPLLGKEIKAPYAYKTDVLNLVKPYRFSQVEASATNAAMRLAVEGDQVSRHGFEQDGGKKQLVVVAAFPPAQSGKIRDRVDNVLDEYNVRTVHEENVSQFIEEVTAQAV